MDLTYEIYTGNTNGAISVERAGASRVEVSTALSAQSPGPVERVAARLIQLSRAKARVSDGIRSEARFARTSSPGMNVSEYAWARSG
jgi:copper homeostasis protein CutC